MKIDTSKKHRTRDGREVTELQKCAVTVGQIYTIQGLVPRLNKDEKPFKATWTKEGIYCAGVASSDMDLFLAPEEIKGDHLRKKYYNSVENAADAIYLLKKNYTKGDSNTLEVLRSMQDEISGVIDMIDEHLRDKASFYREELNKVLSLKEG